MFAQHAQVGDLHIETRYVQQGRWEWFVFKKRASERLYSGDSTSLEAAKDHLSPTFLVGFLSLSFSFGGFGFLKFQFVPFDFSSQFRRLKGLLSKPVSF